MVTVPPPYSPFGISPANLKYSSGWSSTWTARWFFFGSGGMPLGTAHETPTPSFSSRKSQWSRRAWCSWTTNRGDRAAFFGTRASGSGVFLKSLLASYSASFFAMRKRLGHDRCQLLEVHLQADPLGRDLTRPEGTVRGEAFELGRGIGAPLEHLESRAYAPAQFKRLASDSPFRTCEITSQGIGLEVHLKKVAAVVA